MLTRMYISQRRVSDARVTLAQLKRAPSHRSTAMLEARLDAAAGDTDAAVRLLRSTTSPVAQSGAAVLHVMLGDRDRAFALLEQAVTARTALPFWTCDPDLDPIRDDPRFKQLLQRLRLPPTSVAALTISSAAPSTSRGTE
jgi:adenylate cyclase